ncbi:MAG: hypothetical protein EA361_17010 [Bacteroidetes bacterium]|nr:MAG: hypothetical protein EA361_17010 [Bacteroidota bacterium]
MHFSVIQDIVSPKLSKLLFTGALAMFVWAGNVSELLAQERKDTIELHEVQVHAARIFQKETAGMKTTQVDSLIISQKLNLTLSELLSENTPVYIKSHGRGALATASFRGTASSHTQVNWNGIHINSPMLGMVDFSLIPVYIIDDLNLTHGAASVRDQSGGLGGSINISNRADWTNTAQISYTQGIGSFSTWDQYLKTGLGNQKVQWRSRIYYNRSENDYTFINRTIGEIENGEITHPVDTNKYASYYRWGTLQEFYWQPSSQQIVSVQWWGQWADRGIPRVISSEGPQNANIGQQKDSDHKAVARWQWYGEQSSFTLRSGFSHKQLDYTLTNPVSGSEPVPAIYSESTMQSFLQHASWNTQLSPRTTLETNVDFNHHQVQTADSVARTGYNNNRNDLSMLLAIRNQLHERVNINLMLRQEHTNGSFSPLIPFAGLDVLLTQNNPLIFKASIARNYRQPSLNDLYWQPGGNPDLKPEKGFSVEAGLQNSLVFSHISLESEISYFRADIDDWIIWIPSFKGYWEPQNIRKVISQGLEAHTSVGWKTGAFQYRLMGSYSYTRAINHGDPMVWGDESRGKQLVFIPVHSGNLMANLQYKKFSITWQHNSYSERFTTSSNDVSRRNRLYPYYMNDLSLARQWKFSKWNLQAEFKVYNLFNETYHTILYRPMPGRNYMISLKTDINR